MDPKEDEGSVVVFHVHQITDRQNKNYGEGNPIMRINIGTKLLLNHNYI
jgi:hypothetical protein